MANQNGAALKVEKGIPLPVKAKADSVEAKVKTMEVGDSINFPKYATAYYACQFLGKGNYALRKDGESARLWRTK